MTTFNKEKGNELLKEILSTNAVKPALNAEEISKVKFMQLQEESNLWEETKRQTWDYHFETMLTSEEVDFILYYKTAPSPGGWLVSEYFIIQ